MTDRIEYWAEKINSRDYRRIVEVGVDRGDFADGILRRCPMVDSYLMVDPWRTLPDWNKPLAARDHEAAWKAARQVKERHSPRVQMMQTTSAAALRWAVVSDEPGWDLIYIDGDHSLHGIVIDLGWFEHLRPHGTLGGDDAVEDYWHHGPDYEPTLVLPVVAAFAERINHRLELHGTQWSIRVGDVPALAVPPRRYPVGHP